MPSRHNQSHGLFVAWMYFPPVFLFSSEFRPISSITILYTHSTCVNRSLEKYSYRLWLRNALDIFCSADRLNQLWIAGMFLCVGLQPFQVFFCKFPDLQDLPLSAFSEVSNHSSPGDAATSKYHLSYKPRRVLYWGFIENLCYIM